jgi:hypothetical protein
VKYIVLSAKYKTLTQEFPFIFHNKLVHAYAAAVFTELLKAPKYTDITPISAGEYCPANGCCQGGSSTLKLASRGEVDEQLILGSDYGAGYS